MNVTLFGKRGWQLEYNELQGLQMRWLLWVGPKSNNRVMKTQTEERRLTEEKALRGRRQRWE